VGSGFRTEFTFQISVPPEMSRSGPCKVVDQQEGMCSRRGAGGLALVVQASGAGALGAGGAGLGYGGVQNGVAVEFDTWFDPGARDPYENHLAVLSRGAEALLPDHANQIGSTVELPDFADGRPHRARVVYSPAWSGEDALHPSFQASPHLASLMRGLRSGLREGKWWAASGPAPLHQGLGLLRVFVDDTPLPALTVPLNLEAFLDLKEGGRAWVGFTAATGDSFQQHDVLAWDFSGGGIRGDARSEADMKGSLTPELAPGAPGGGEAASGGAEAGGGGPAEGANSTGAAAGPGPPAWRAGAGVSRHLPP